MTQIATRLFIKALIIFLFGAFLGMVSTGCSSKEPEPDPVVHELTPEKQALLDRGKQEEAKYGNQPPKATAWDSIGYRMNSLNIIVKEEAKSVGQSAAVSIVRTIMLLLSILVIIFIPGFIFGRYEMIIEGFLLAAAGIVLLATGWPEGLGNTHWVWGCLIVPGVLLFAFGWFFKEGFWKLYLVFGPHVIMVLMSAMAILDTAMHMLIKGSFIAIAGLIVYNKIKKKVGLESE